MKKIRDEHALKHLDAEIFHQPRIDVDMIFWVNDVLHGEALNIAKVDFKYSFLDGILGMAAHCPPIHPLLVCNHTPCVCGAHR